MSLPGFQQVAQGQDFGPPPRVNPLESGQFDLLDWHPAYQSCQEFFLDHAQYDASVQAVASLVNIYLPYQWRPTAVRSSLPLESASSSNDPADDSSGNEPRPESTASTFATSRPRNLPSPPPYLTMSLSRKPRISLIPFIRRLVVTGFDHEPVMHGFFGDDWRKGVGPLQECERRNYLFAAKVGPWTKVKTQYDMGPQETVPFLQPLRNVQFAEIENADKLWDQWSAMEEWLVSNNPLARTSRERADVELPI